MHPSRDREGIYNDIYKYIMNLLMKRTLVSFGAGRSTIIRRTSARRTVTGTPRRTVALTSASAPPGLTTDLLYIFTTSAF